MKPETERQRSAVSSPVAPRVPRLYWFIALALAGLSSFFPSAPILVYGVNAPFWDEWGLTGLIKAVRTEQAAFETFWAPDNEYRNPDSESCIQSANPGHRMELDCHHGDLLARRSPDYFCSTLL
jgi:hypothetical protein